MVGPSRTRKKDKGKRVLTGYSHINNSINASNASNTGNASNNASSSSISITTNTGNTFTTASKPSAGNISSIASTPITSNTGTRSHPYNTTTTNPPRDATAASSYNTSVSRSMARADEYSSRPLQTYHQVSAQASLQASQVASQVAAKVAAQVFNASGLPNTVVTVTVTAEHFTAGNLTGEGPRAGNFAAGDLTGEDSRARNFTAGNLTAENFAAEAYTAAPTGNTIVGPGQINILNPTSPTPGRKHMQSNNSKKEVNMDMVEILQDLEFKPGGIPDFAPGYLSQFRQDYNSQYQALMAAMPPRPKLAPPLPGPSPNLEAEFQEALAKTQVANAMEATGLVEPVVSPKKLVVVCCLATWIGERDSDDNMWVVIPGQETRKGWGMDMANPSEKECWKRQIWKGLQELAVMGEKGVLMGPWYKGKPTSAAQSYLDYCKTSNYFNMFKADKYNDKDLPSRIFTEDRAMDSFQNIIFSLIEFNKRYRNFPEEMTVISYELKRTRFEELHFKAAKAFVFPTAQIGIDVTWQGIPTFIGIDPRELHDPSKQEKRLALMELEMQRFDLWRLVPFGMSDDLKKKKKERNVWNIDLTYPLVFAGGPELVAATERKAKEAPPLEEVLNMSVN
ncbi:hypothetical protein V490_02674 [Pseudogymnoascus sp. VKM F-3557]|nr:hypothetical protein V490_02674 [Pseudogymnoascus sp. VKM F-3557]